jgi:hypothetical protein
MTNGNYVRHLSVLGKLANLYDLAGADAPAINAGLAGMLDQVADGQTDSVAIALAFAQWGSQVSSAVTNGPTAVQTAMLNAARYYLTQSYFYSDLTTVPTATTPLAVLTALATEMGAGVDNKTLTTKASTGLVNFFDVIRGTNGTWNTAADGSADYKDSVYCVSAPV